MGRRGVLIAAVLIAAFGGGVVRDAVPADHEAQERAAATPVASTPVASTTTVPSTTTTLPPPPSTTATPPPNPAEVQVAGIVVTRPAEPEPIPSAPPPCPAPGGADFVDALVNDHRSIRCQQGAGDLTLEPAVSENAQFHANRLMVAGACSSLFHSSELPQWYSTSYWGENAACVAWSRGCSSDAGYIVDGWMNSDAHRPNILDPHFQWIGVGVACDGTHTYIVVQFRS